MKHFLSVSKKLVAVCLAVLLAVVTVPALSVSATDYQVTLHGNGGETADGKETKVVSASSFVYTDNNGFTREGYTFTGWENAAGDEITTPTVTTNVDYFATWALGEYKVIHEVVSLSETDYQNNKSIVSGDKSNTSFGVVNYTWKTYYTEEELGFALPSNDSVMTALNLDSRIYSQVSGWHYIDANGKLHKVNNVCPEEAFEENNVAELAFVVIKNNYSVTYDLNGGSWVDASLVKSSFAYETAVSAPTPVKAGSHFGGWVYTYNYYNSGSTTANAVVKGSLDCTKYNTGVTAYAKWTQNYVINYVNLTHFAKAEKELADYKEYEKSGSNFVFVTDINNDGTLNDSTLLDALNITMEPGYTFLGWYTNAALEGTAVTSLSQLGGHTVNLYARVEYTVTLDLAGGAATGAQTNNSIAVGSSYTLLALKKNGYDFVGYAETLYSNGSVLKDANNEDVVKIHKAGEVLTAPIISYVGNTYVVATLKAVWEEKEYTISYNYAGGEEYITGTVVNPTTITLSEITAESITLNKSKKTGYVEPATWYIKGTNETIATTAEIQTKLITNASALNYDNSKPIELVAVFPANLTPETYYVYYLQETVNGNGTLKYGSKTGWVYYQTDIDGNKISEIGEKADWEKLYQFDENVTYKVKFGDSWVTSVGDTGYYQSSNSTNNTLFADTSAKNLFIAEAKQTIYSGTDGAHTTDVSKDFNLISIKDQQGNYRYYIREKVTTYYIGLNDEQLPNGYDVLTEIQVAALFDVDLTDSTKLTGNNKYMPSYSIANEYTIVDDLSDYRFATGSIRFTGWVDKNGNQVTGKVGKSNLPETEEIDIATGTGYEGKENVLFLYATWARADLLSVKYNLAGGELAAGVSPINYYSNSTTVASATASRENALNVSVATQTNNHFEVLSGATVSKPGYNFGGLYKAADKTGGNYTAENINLKANSSVYVAWEAINKSIVFNLDGGTVANADKLGLATHNTSDLKYENFTIEGFDITKVAPTKTGYTFVGWYTSNSVDLSVDKAVTSLDWTKSGDVVNLYAIYKANTYTITYILNGGSFGSTQVAIQFTYGQNSGSIVKALPTYAHYTIDTVTGATKDSTNFTINTNTAHDIEVEFTWKVDEIDIKYYKENSTEFTGSETDIKNNAYNENKVKFGAEVKFYDVVYVNDTIKAQKEFLGWYNYPQNEAETQIGYGKDVKQVYSTKDLQIANDGDYHVYAWFKAVEYKVTYVLNGGEIDVDYYVENGYKADACYDSEVDYGTASNAIKTPFIVKAGYYGHHLNTIPDPDPDVEVSDVVWCLDSTLLVPVNGTTKVTKDITLYAKWTKRTEIAISYDTNGGVLTDVADKINAYNYPIYPSTYAYKELAIEGTATKTGYTFVGWSYNGQIIKSLPANIVADKIELVAEYKANEVTFTFHNVLTLDAAGKIATEETFTQTTAVGETVGLAALAGMKFTAPENKAFSGWAKVYTSTSADYADGELVIVPNSNKDQYDFYALWGVKNVITFVNVDECGLAVNNPNPVALSSDLYKNGYYYLQTPTMEGHIFKGFYSDPDCLSIYKVDYVTEGTKTIYMAWTPISYTITYVTGSELSTVTKGSYNTHDGLAKLPTATLFGYNFAGWVDANGNKVTSIAAGQKGDITLKATWSLKTLTQAFVERSYSKFFGRDADIEGRDYWVDELDRGIQTGASLILNHYLSKEYQSALAKIEDKEAKYKEFVMDLYQVMMNRSYDEVGLRYWVNEMLAGQKAEDVIKNFARSEEFKEICEEYNIKNIIEK